MTPTATLDSAQVPFSVSKNDGIPPELLALRFVGDDCVEGTAGQLWQTLFAVDCDATSDVPRILPEEMIKSLLAISREAFPGELSFWKSYLVIRGQPRCLEAQISVNSFEEHVILLRDVTVITRIQSHYERSTALLAMLSPRELEVLGLLVFGEPNKTVAARLKISAKTVEKHRASIVRKTGARNSAELIRLTCLNFCDPMCL
ncbi:MAG TPA: LuxR C-terminal-related transcriptional regulator [Planctomycetaceae bacterium]|nr:LuxR C-terminal-related transcriptional regulator [Planctomycetaceae bacterium]HQZ66061.1 LuxR C-terminal-related transcriptional regulator [Planctomycetaceae bacterium]